MATYSSYNTITLSVEDFSYKELQSIQHVFSYNKHHTLWQMAERLMEFIDSDRTRGQEEFPLSVADVGELLNTVGGSNGIKLRPQVERALQAVVDEANQRMQQNGAESSHEETQTTPQKPALLRTNGKANDRPLSLGDDLEHLRQQMMSGHRRDDVIQEVEGWSRDRMAKFLADVFKESHMVSGRLGAFAFMADLDVADQASVVERLIERLAQSCIKKTGPLGFGKPSLDHELFDEGVHMVLDVAERYSNGQPGQLRAMVSVELLQTDRLVDSVREEAIAGLQNMRG